MPAVTVVSCYHCDSLDASYHAGCTPAVTLTALFTRPRLDFLSGSDFTLVLVGLPKFGPLLLGATDAHLADTVQVPHSSPARWCVSV